jgi:hypothetical protein
MATSDGRTMRLAGRDLEAARVLIAAHRLRGVPAVDRARSSAVRPAGLLSGQVDGLDERDGARSWAEAVSGSGVYAGLDADELEAMALAREKEYELGELLDQELGISLPEVGVDVMAAAAADLKVRGIALDDASQEQLLAALLRVSA